MITKPANWDSINPITGGAQRLPAGGYVCEIVSAVNGMSRAGNPQLILVLDVCEGEYAGYFRETFENRKQYNAEAKWPSGGCYYQRTQGDFNALGRFKGMIMLIEKENAGYTWDWNEKSLIGKRIGAVFGEETYIGNDNKEHTSIRCAYLREIAGVENVTPPAKKEQKQQTSPAYADDIPF